MEQDQLIESFSSAVYDRGFFQSMYFFTKMRQQSILENEDLEMMSEEQSEEVKGETEQRDEYEFWVEFDIKMMTNFGRCMGGEDCVLQMKQFF